MNKIFILTITTLLVVFSSCKRNDLTVCTEEFRSIIITIYNAELDDYYTIRESSGDTIRHENSFSGENSYTVLDDNYKEYLVNQQETFRFEGFINDVKVVSELFVIKADECHIEGERTNRNYAVIKR